MYELITETLIKQRMLDRITNAIDKLEGSFTHDAIAPVAMELASLYIELDRVLTMTFAKTATGEYLDMRASEFGIFRRSGNKAAGMIRFLGTDGVVIPEGTMVQTEGGLVYTTVAVTTLSSGYADISIIAENIGVKYNVPSNTISQLPVQIVGISSVTNSQPTTGGADVEADAELLTRLLLKVQAPSTSGNLNDYKLWVLEVPGIGDAKIFPLWDGNGTVKLILIDSNKQPVDVNKVNEVITYIETLRPIGATVTVEPASTLVINISVVVIKDTTYTLEQVTNNITAKLTEYLKTAAFKDSYISYAKIGNCIMDSDGVLDYSELLLNAGTANIVISYTSAITQTPVLGSVDIT